MILELELSSEWSIKSAKRLCCDAGTFVCRLTLIKMAPIYQEQITSVAFDNTLNR